MRFNRLLLLLGGAMAVLLPGTALSADAAGSFPTRPVSIVVPFAPGGGAGIEVVLLQRALSENLKRSVIIDYKPGAGGSVGTIYVAKVAPDGYTILGSTISFTANAAFFPPDKMPYDPVKDFAPISLGTRRDNFLVASPGFPARNLKEYLAYAKANPGKINFGTSGSGSLIHIAGAWLDSVTNTQSTIVHYKGLGPLINDLMAGRLDTSVGPPSVMGPHLRTGKLNAIVNLSAGRSKFLPDLPSISEQGYPEYSYSTWSCYLAPAMTPPAIINRWVAAFAFAGKAAEVIQQTEAGVELVMSSPEVLAKQIAVDFANQRKIIANAGIKLE